MLKEVGKDIRAGPQLQQLTGKTLQSSALTGTEVRLTQTPKDMLTKTSHP